MFVFSYVEGSVMSNLQAHVMLRAFQRSSSSLVTNLDRETERRKDFQVPSRFLDEAEILGLELNYTYRYP
jgi:hypothetical protein